MVTPMAKASEKAKPAVSAQDNSEKRQLPASYFQELLELPACKSKGCCDDCGKCER